VTTLAQLHQQFIDDFFSAIEPLHRENKNPSSFGYLDVKPGEEFYLVQGALILNVAPFKTPFSHFRSDNVRAGNYRLTLIMKSKSSSSGQMPKHHVRDHCAGILAIHIQPSALG
jgi:hypothetical protein